MAYAIRSPKGKERAVIRALEASGIIGKKFYLGEYVLCREEPPISRINHLAETRVDVKKISDEEMDRLLAATAPPAVTEAQEPAEHVEPGKLVKITRGEYEGLEGIVSGVEDDTVSVDVSTAGRMLPVTVSCSAVSVVIPFKGGWRD